MNTLAYGLLSLLSRSADSGYDLMLKIKPFWPAKHSQIYPLLAQLESDGLVQHVLVVQTDKPDKKVYSLTDKGKEALRAWLGVPADDPVTRDELTLKLYCMDQGDPADIRLLLEQRVAYCNERLKWLQAKIEAYKSPPNASPLPVVLLIQKARFYYQSDLEWAEWALQQVPDHEKEPQPD